jgi:hypothetical protein
MATITATIRKSYGGRADLIPAHILKSIPQDELLDRLSYADDLITRPCDPQLKEGYALLRKAVLTAQPRETTERAVTELHVLAGRTRDARRAGEMRDAAARLMEQNPIAPRRADVAKSRAAGGTAAEPARHRVAKAALQVAVYNDRGRVAGLVDRARIVQRVAKAGTAKPAQVAVYDQNGALCGICDPADIQPLTTPKASIGNPASLTPMPPGEVGTPADDVAKAKVDVAKAAAGLKRTFRDGDPAEQNRAAAAMNLMAAAGLADLHRRGARPRPRPARGR